VITADQLVAHAVGDYLLQSDWMANEKTKRHVAAAAHAITYALPFLFFHPSLAAMAVIIGTHFVIDRWRLARFVVFAKNRLAPRGRRSASWAGPQPTQGEDSRPVIRHREWRTPWKLCRNTGYPDDRPAWLAVWLLIIADNVLHVLINGAALRWLP
jgi:hypothetical protein